MSYNKFTSEVQTTFNEMAKKKDMTHEMAKLKMLKKKNKGQESEILRDIQRSIVKNFLDTIILAKLKTAGSLNGYDVMKYIHMKYDLMISSGTIYSVIYSLERKDLIKGECVDKKREYALTEKGLETIETILNHQEKIYRYLKLCISE